MKYQIGQQLQLSNRSVWRIFGVSPDDEGYFIYKPTENRSGIEFIKEIHIDNLLRQEVNRQAVATREMELSSDRQAAYNSYERELRESVRLSQPSWAHDQPSIHQSIWQTITTTL